MIKSIVRSHCVVCGNLSLEHLYTINSFPVFVGCVNHSPEKDLRMDMSFVICRKCGTIQLSNLVPLEILYQENHNESVGKTWREHHTQFSNFIELYERGENRLEIGGASGVLASIFRLNNTSGKWLIVEPNPIQTQPSIPNTEFFSSFFDANFCPPFEIDTLIHSHVMEHWYEPSEVLKYINQLLKLGKRMIFSIPNMEFMLTNKYTNCLLFEHTYYLPEDTAIFLLENYGFQVIAKKNFGNHSIFFACEKIKDVKDVKVKLLPSRNIPDNYKKNKLMYADFISTLKQDVFKINKIVKDYQHEVYIFGAHIFSQYLFMLGLEEDRFSNILDNASKKIGKRLYGTNLMVKSPLCLKDHKEALVILRAAGYNDEIKSDILTNINPNTIFY